MGGGGGRPKEAEVWKHVTVLEGKKKKVKCNRCGFVFAASNNRIKYHINQIEGQGIRTCTVSNKGTNEKQDLLDSKGLLTMDRQRDYNRLDERMVDCYMSPKTMWEGIKALPQVQMHTETRHREERGIKVGPFHVSSTVMDEFDLRLIQFVFENPSETCIPFSSPHLHLRQSQLITFRPQTHLDSGIIDAFADILTEIETRKNSKPFSWYLPVMFWNEALDNGANSFLDFGERLRKNSRFDYLKDCEKVFVPVHVEKDSCGHYYLYIIHMENQEIEIWDSLHNQFIDKAKRDQITQKLLLAMGRLFGDDKFKEFYCRLIRNIPLQRSGRDCGIFVINYMQQLDNYVKENPLFQFDSNEERLNLVLKLLKSDLNQKRETLYTEVTRWHCAQLESENKGSRGTKSKEVDSDNKVTGNNIGLKTGMGKRMISMQKKHQDDAGVQEAQFKKDLQQILTSTNQISVIEGQVREMSADIKSLKESFSHLTAGPSNGSGFYVVNQLTEPAGPSNVSGFDVVNQLTEPAGPSNVSGSCFDFLSQSVGHAEFSSHDLTLPENSPLDCHRGGSLSLG